MSNQDKEYEFNEDSSVETHEVEHTETDLTPGTPRRNRKKLMRGTRMASLVFTLLATFIGSGIAIFAANTYYNLDTSEIVVDSVQRVVNALRATGGLIVGGTDGQDPATNYSFEVAGTDGVRFSTTGPITQTGGGNVTFNGLVALNGATAGTFGLRVGAAPGGTDGTGAVAHFDGRVHGSEATVGSHFVTLSQLQGGGGDGIDVGVMSLNTLQGALSLNSPSNVIDISTSGTSVINLDVAALSIDSSRLAANSVITDKIVNDAVTTAKIDNLAVTNAKLAAGAVTNGKIVDNTIENIKLVNPYINFTAADGIRIDGDHTRVDYRVDLGTSVTIGVDAQTIAGNFFQQGGNAFGTPETPVTATLGTTNAANLEFITNGVVRAFIDTTGLTTFNGNIVLAGGDRSITTGTGSNKLTLNNGSTGNIEFFGPGNHITSTGNLTIAGNFAMSGLTLTDDGSGNVTLATTGDFILNPGGDVRLGAGKGLFSGGGFDLTDGYNLVEVLPIFKYEVPVRCGTSCTTGSPAEVGIKLDPDMVPVAATGTTREYRLTVRYSTSGTANVEWTADNFTFTTDGTSGLNNETIFTSGAFDGDDFDWELTAGSADTLQVSEVFLSVYDKINK